MIRAAASLGMGSSITSRGRIRSVEAPGDDDGRGRGRLPVRSTISFCGILVGLGYVRFMGVVGRVLLFGVFWCFMCVPGRFLSVSSLRGGSFLSRFGRSYLVRWVM